MSRADIVVVFPKLLWHLIAADTLKQSPAIFHCSPFQNTTNRNMEHDRVIVLQDCRIKNTRLTECNPLFDRRIGDDTLCLCFSQSVVVICRYANWVASASPMQWLATVTHLSYTTDIDNLGLLILRLRQHRISYIGRSRNIGAESSLRTVVCLRRNHATHVENDIGSCDTTKDIIVVGKITPDDFYFVS